MDLQKIKYFYSHFLFCSLIHYIYTHIITHTYHMYERICICTCVIFHAIHNVDFLRGTVRRKSEVHSRKNIYHVLQKILITFFLKCSLSLFVARSTANNNYLHLEEVRLMILDTWGAGWAGWDEGRNSLSFHFFGTEGRSRTRSIDTRTCHVRILNEKEIHR